MEFREQQGTISFDEAERRYDELKRRHDAGHIDEEEFDAERQRLLVVDDEGRWWAKSRKNGRWHYNDGSAWIEATPPVFYQQAGSEDSPEQLEPLKRAEYEAKERYCTNCGAPMGPKARFCVSCGEHALPEAGASLVPGMAPGQPGHRRPGVQRPGGGRSGLLIGLGVLCAVLAVGLIVTLAYTLLAGEDTAEEPELPAEQPVPVAEQPELETAREPKKAEPKAADSKAAAPQEAVKAAVRDHYEAIGAGDFEEAYSYFGPTFRSTNDQASWVATEKTNQIRGSTVNDVKVEGVSDTTATATVDVSFQDKTGNPRFVLTWDLVKEGGEWKLDSQTSGQKVN